MPYVFRHGYARITTREFPHSEIPGSKVGQHLPEAYRSRPRPSSALGAKASTVCSYSLDRKEHVLMSLWSFQGARGLGMSVAEHGAHLQRTPLRRRLPAHRSLKTQQRTGGVSHRGEISACFDEVNIDLGELCDRTSSRRAWNASTSTAPIGASSDSLERR